MSWANHKESTEVLFGLPLTGSSRLWDAYLAARTDVGEARRERRESEKTGDVELFHIDNIVKAELRLKEAEREYLETCTAPATPGRKRR